MLHKERGTTSNPHCTTGSSRAQWLFMHKWQHGWWSPKKGT